MLGFFLLVTRLLFQVEQHCCDAESRHIDCDESALSRYVIRWLDGQCVAGAVASGELGIDRDIDREVDGFTGGVEGHIDELLAVGADGS